MALYSKCKWCGERVPYRQTRCDKCQIEYDKYKNNNRDLDLKKFRNSRAWKKKAKEIMKYYHYQCQACEVRGIDKVADEVHHIVPLSVDFDKRWDWDNLVPLCYECHDMTHTGELVIHAPR